MHLQVHAWCDRFLPSRSLEIWMVECFSGWIFFRPDLGFRIVCEQVSHHPPVSAFHAESEDYILHGSVHPKLKFWGKSIEVAPKGDVTLHLLKQVIQCCSVLWNDDDELAYLPQGFVTPSDEICEAVSHCLPHRQWEVNNLFRDSTYYLGSDSNPLLSASGCASQGHHHLLLFVQWQSLCAIV